MSFGTSILRCAADEEAVTDQDWARLSRLA
jgi:hypothetical protein